MTALRVDIPEKLKPLLLPARYKILHGGRGGAKSWSVARIKAVTCAFSTHRLLCAREVQRSLRESVHQLMKDQIQTLGLGHRLTALESEIRGTENDSLILYAGLQAHTAMSIKSYEGVDAVWVEEAQSVQKRSWEILTPTIRRPGSEIWATANLDLETDYFTQHFVRNPPEGAVVIEINHEDNPWFTKELEDERKTALERMDPDDYAHIWRGKARGAVKGAIYGTQIRALRAIGRIGRVAPRKDRPLNAFLDLGSSVGNATAVWFHQQHGRAHLFPGYIHAEGQGMRYFWEEMEKFRTKHSLKWDTIYLPHDGNANLQGAELQSRKDVLEQLADESRTQVVIETVPRVQRIAVGIEATRERLMDAWFDEEECADGLRALEHYSFKWNDETQSFLREPAHTWASNGADALRQWAQGYPFEGNKPPPDDPRNGPDDYVRGAY